MDVITARELTKVYTGGRHNIVALDKVTFSVKPREVFGLLGPNGAGKTTFLKVILGITHMTAGQVTVNGCAPVDPRSREHVGYLPENHRFPDYLTGLGLLELTGRLYGLSVSVIDERAEYLLNLVGMDRWASHRMRKYSKGMLQRIGLAQAMIADPDILLLDEPTDGVDPVGKAEIREVIKKVRDEGKSVVLNSHLISEVEAVADRVAILQRGKLVRVSNVEDLTRRARQYEIEASIGSNLVEIPPDKGKIITVSAGGLLVELTADEHINYLIDQLRLMKISIKSVKPLRVSLEQTFLETISTGGETLP